MIKIETILLSSYVKLPTNTTAQKIYDQLVLVAVVDINTGRIVKVDCSLVTALAKSFLNQIMAGYNLNSGVAELQEKIDRWYYGHLKKSLLTAAKLLCVQYDEFKTRNDVNTTKTKAII